MIQGIKEDLYSKDYLLGSIEYANGNFTEITIKNFEKLQSKDIKEIKDKSVIRIDLYYKENFTPAYSVNVWNRTSIINKDKKIPEVDLS